MGLRASRALVAALAVLAVGCGGDDDDAATADDYRADLESLCVEQRDLVAALPQRQADENLDSDQVREIAEGYADDFRTGVEDLEPPGDLEGAHAELVALLAEDLPDADVDGVTEIYERLATVYDDLGAAACADGVRATIDVLEQAEENLPPDDFQD